MKSLGYGASFVHLKGNTSKFKLSRVFPKESEFNYAKFIIIHIKAFKSVSRKPTHDFLSLYSPVHQDPRPSQGGYLKTRDFLQLEQGGRNNGKEESTVEKTTSEKPLPPAPAPSVERLLPGGIGTYKSVVQKGKTGKENIAGDSHVIRDAGMKIGGQWTTSERLSQSSSNSLRNSTPFSSLSSSQPSSVQKNQSLMNIIKTAKGTHEEEDDDEDDFDLKKEPSSHYKGNLTVKVDGKSTDQKANTPRSKHSATEQRRRSKINDRFQMLRELIPHSDQKRDKASFLLEVIEYIQVLQEKVHKYEGSYQGWNHDPAKLMPWRNNHRPVRRFC
ncbi:hypothetical protein F0562_023510 [Nyssa sinensis]|uniref:BHLH domain-containing protein n=1 Tax=Nyssa sinensis TaxID=561372 RepID=A0A5J5BI36_9ASTE|nr:hypothetical protein F0562_023510 [Nyssa sinensis]